MRSRTVVLWWLGAMLGGSVAVHGGGPAAHGAVAGPEVRVAVLVPLTGVFTDWGRKNRVAFQIAEEEVRAAGGIDGVQVKLILEDSGSSPAEAAKLFRKVVTDDRVLAVIGPFSSGQCEVVYPLAKQMQAVALSHVCAKPGISAPHRPWAFRNNIDEMKMAEPTVKKFIATYGIKRVVVVHDAKEAIAQDLGARVLPARFKAEGVQIVNEGSYVTFITKDIDFSPQVTRLKGLQFDGVAFGGLAPDAINFLKEMRRQGLTQPLVGGSPLNSGLIHTQGGAAVEGTFTPSTFWTDSPSPRARQFVEKFRARAAAAGLTTTPEYMDANAYDTVFILLETIRRMGVTNRPEDLAKDRERIMQGLTSIKSYEGIAGKLGFDENGDAVKEVHVLKAQGGRWVRVE